VERTLLTNQAGMRNLGANKQGLFSVALIHVNDKQAIESLPAVVAIVKNSLGDAHVVILFENEYRQ
jgi:hypothetical protein